MKIGVLVTGHPPDGMTEQGTYDRYFDRLMAGNGFEVIGWNVVDDVFPPGIDAADGWLITGSRHGAYEALDWIAPLEEFIRAVHAARMPMIGICFGHQIIAQALGGRVAKFEGGWSVGRTEYRMMGRSYAINAWHQDQVVEKPAEAEVIATTDFCAHAGLSYGEHIWTIQPHPEYGSDFMRGLIEKRGKGVVPQALLDAASAHLDAPTDRLEIGQIMAEFFKKERA